MSNIIPGAERAAKRTAAAALPADYQRAAETADVADRAMWAARLADMLGYLLAARGRMPELLGCELTVSQALADGIRWERVRAAGSEQIGLYLMAADVLGLAQEFGPHHQRGQGQARDDSGPGRRGQRRRGPVPVSAAEELAALDRGVIDAGMTAAEAVARVEILEAPINVLFAMMRDTWKAAGLPVPEETPARRTCRW